MNRRDFLISATAAIATATGIKDAHVDEVEGQTVLSVKRRLTEEEKDRIRAEFMRKWSGPSNAYRFLELLDA